MLVRLALRPTRFLTLALLVALSACGRSSEIGEGEDGHGDEARPDAGEGGSVVCDPPDVLVLLDRTQSMHKRPDGTSPPDSPAGRMSSKWFIALDAIESLAAELDDTMRFGLALFPRDPGNGSCVTLSERLAGTTATNPSCEAGEVVVAPTLAGSAPLAEALDATSTRLCNTTPIGAGLSTARAALQDSGGSNRDQYVLFVGDGRDTCDESLAIASVQDLASDGVRTFVVSFDGSGKGTDPALLDNLACAGRTAVGFPGACTDTGAGRYRATNPGAGAPLYYHAENSVALEQALSDIAAVVSDSGCID